MLSSRITFFIVSLLRLFACGQPQTIHHPRPTEETNAPMMWPNKMLVFRTFATSDFHNLESGFKSWDSQHPCSVASNTTKVDILLLFSAPWSSCPEAREAAEFVSSSFHGGNYSWARCFNDLFVESAMIPLEEDLYDTRLMGIHELWVNGPNRQFERAVKIAAEHGYEIAYLMESDSQPVQVHWLDSLLAEINATAPFAVLGRLNCNKIRESSIIQ